MKRFLIILSCVFVVVIAARAWYNHAHFVVPELHARPAGLQIEEFKRQQQRYSMLVAAIDKAPTESKNYTALAKLFMTEARVSGDHPYYYPAAMQCLNEALRRNEHAVEASMLKTSVLLSLHHFAEARDLAQSLAGQYSHTSALYGMLCDANVELGDVDAALRNVDEMMRLRPGLDSYSRAAYLREIHGDMDGAFEAMTMASNAGLPGSEEAAWTRSTLATMYLRHAKLDEAQQQFERAISERPNYPAAMAGLAMILHKQNQDAKALNLLDSALSLQPEVAFVEKKAEIMNDRGMTAQRDSLMGIVEKMLDEDQAAGHYNDAERAITYCRMQYKVDKALKHAQAELAKRPNNMTAQYAMALSLVANSRADEAKAYIDQALRRGTKDPDMLACAERINQQRQLRSRN